MKTSALDIANYLLFLTSDAVDDVSILTIIKLLYYAQGHALQEGIDLFDDEVRAGEHGPIVEPVYHKYEKWGSGPIKEWDEEQAKAIPEELQDFLLRVAAVYSRYSASQLRWMTHQPHTPWSNNFVEGGRYRIIPTKEIESYFKHNVSPLSNSEDVELSVEDSPGVYRFKIVRDNEADVWFGSNDDTGLVLEDESCDNLIRRLKEALPEMVEINALPAIKKTVFDTESI